jgi:beta-galactosidase
VEAHRRSWFDDRGLVVDGAARPWRAATVAYWRLPRGRWPRALAALRELGLTLVEVPVPWAIHERDAGRYDFAGDRDLGGFLDAVAAADLGAVLQLGPLSSLTETHAALPDRIVADGALWARTSRDTPAWLPLAPRAFPLPSLASDRFTAELATWYRAVGEVAAPRTAPHGPIVAVGLDGGLAHAVRGGAYDVDYHPDALAAWRVHRDEEPPRRWSDGDGARAAAWVRWNAGALGRAARRWSTLLDEVGLAGLARIGGAPPVDPSGDHDATPWPRQLDLASGTGPRAPIALRLAMAGAPALVRLPAGHAAHFAPTTDDERAAVTLAALAAGARGATWTMGVATDRWLGGLVDGDGAVTAEGRRVARLLAALERHDLPALHRQAEVALIVPRADAAFGRARSLVAPLPEAALELLALGPGGAAELSDDPDAARARRWRDAVVAALELGQVGYVAVAADAPAASLGARAIVHPTLARIETATWDTLRALSAERRVIVIGPDTPTRDELDQPLAGAAPRRLGLMRAGSLDDLPGLAADLAALAPRDAWYALRPAGIVVTPWLTVDGRVRAVFVEHRGAKPARAVVAVPHDASLHDALDGTALTVRDGEVALDLPAHGARWLIVGG